MIQFPLEYRQKCQITSLLTYVPISLAAMHQSRALVTLSTALWSSHELKLMKVLKHVPK